MFSKSPGENSIFPCFLFIVCEAKFVFSHFNSLCNLTFNYLRMRVGRDTGTTQSGLDLCYRNDCRISHKLIDDGFKFL
jgi:hypothetical protein